ncbi:hypothetical protein CANINC_000210, partial [Pichia inconspicua]
QRVDNKHEQKLLVYALDDADDKEVINFVDEMVHRHKSIFSDPVSQFPQHDFEYTVRLEGFDFHKPTPFYANTIHARKIKEFIDDSVENNVLESITDDSLVALAPVFPITQKNKTRVVTDFRRINESLKYGMAPIPPIDLLIQS